MDDFLGTSIQYSERQILLLEQQHAAEQERTVQELIDSGFLDSDSEDSTEDSLYTDIQELTPSICMNDCIECNIDDSDLNISGSSSEQLHSECKYDLNTAADDTQMMMYSNSDISTVSDGEFVSECIWKLHDIMITDIKSWIVLFMLMVILPQMIVNHRQQSSVYNRAQQRDEIPSNINGGCLHDRNIPIFSATSIYYIYDSDKVKEERINMIFSSKKRLNCDLLCDEKYIESQEVPRLFLHFGTAFKSHQMSRFFKETATYSVGRQMMRTHHITALIMSFVGIAAFAVSSSNVEEYLANNA